MSHDVPAGRTVDRRILIEGVGVVAASLLWLVAGYRWVAWLATHPTAFRWLVPAGAVVAYVAAFLWWHRDAVRDTDGRAVRSLGIANAVTLARAGLIAGVAGFVALDVDGVLAWGPALGYGTAVVLDAADGAIARSLGTETRLGVRLDLAVDTTGFLVVPVVAVAWGALPVWYLSLSAARYGYRAGCALYRVRGGTVGDLPPSRVRRPLAALQMVFLTVALVPVVQPSLVWTVAPAVLLPSLAVFVRDLLAVTVGATEE